MGGQPDRAVYAVTLERGTDGTYLAWVHELPGCAVRADSRATVLERLPGAIAEFLTWAGAASPAAVEIEVAEEVDSAIEADEDTEVLVSADRAPLTSDDWRRVADWLGRSRAELLDVLSRLTGDDLGDRRKGSDRTVREELEHVGFVELMYALWTFDLRSPEGLADFLTWTRELASERLEALAERNDERTTQADWAGAPRPEQWTANKAARRLLWHELLHLRALQRGI
jgi:predicted RNase H-like HicB family nuclease